MSAQDILNLFTELWKRDQMPGLPRILSFFRNGFNKFNTKGARTLYFIYYIYSHIFIFLSSHILFIFPLVSWVRCGT